MMGHWNNLLMENFNYRRCQLYGAIGLCLVVLLWALPRQAMAERRIELDYKFTTDTRADFYMLSHFLDDREEITLQDKTYQIKKSPNEFFIDYYYDTPGFYLLKNQASLRLRYRFIHGQLAKRLVQFKSPSSQNDKAMNEWKIKVDSDVLLEQPNDVPTFLSQPQNLEKPLVKKLKTHVNLTSLRNVIEIDQIRTRYYFSTNKGNTHFTITFDDIFARDGMNIEPFYEIEFEINEKEMGKADKKKGEDLIARIEALINEAKSTHIELYPVDQPKYERAMKLHKVDLNEGTQMIFLISIVLIIAIGLFVLFKVIRKKDIKS